MNSKLKKYMTIIALGLAGGSIYFLPFVKYVFYDAQIAAMGISNTQSSLLLTMYSIGNTILYIPGGILADKISSKKALVVSLLSTAVLGLIYAFTMNFVIAMIVWLGLSFSTAFVFWSALMKAVRLAGTEEEQGFTYGLYYACNGLSGALTNAIALQVYKMAGGDMRGGFVRAVIAGCAVSAVAGILLLFLLDDKKEDPNAESDEPKFEIRDAGKLLKKPVVWFTSIAIMCAYGYYSCMSYFTPYLTEVVGASVEGSGLITIIRTYLLLLLAPVGGILADKVFKSTCKWLTVAFLLLAASFAVVMALPSSISVTVAMLYTLIPGAICTMMYSVVFSVVSEAGIPRAMTGTVIGLASIIGYLPDSIYNILFGRWLDAHGIVGYDYIFTFLAVSGVVGAVMAVLIYRSGRAKKETAN